MTKIYVEQAISEESKEENTHFSEFTADDIEMVESKEFNSFFAAEMKGKLFSFQEACKKVLSFLLSTKTRVVNPNELVLYQVTLQGPSPYLYLGE